MFTKFVVRSTQTDNQSEGRNKQNSVIIKKLSINNFLPKTNLSNNKIERLYLKNMSTKMFKDQ